MQKKARIEILSNVRCRATGVPKAVLKYLDAQLAEAQKGSEWAPNHRRFGGRWDGKRHHFHVSPTQAGVGTFPKGLLHRVRSLMAKQKLRAKTVDLRKRVLPDVDLAKLSPTSLHGVSMTGKYSYQFDALKAALAAQSGILFMATNAGKTEIASAIVQALDQHTVLFVVPKAILLKQTRERLAERLGTIPEAIGVIGGGRFEPKEITIAIINSVTPARKVRSPRVRKRNEILRAYLKSVDVIFLDEGHHTKAATWAALMRATPNAQFRYVMSGTPFTGDNDLLVEAAAGPVIYEVRNDQLIKLGVSAKPTVRVVSVHKPNLDQHDDQSWDGIYKAGIVHNEYRNKLIARIADDYAKQGKAVFILVRQLAQGSNLIALIKSPVEFVHGQMPEPTRDKLVEWFANAKRGRILVASSGVFDEGVDIPVVNALIIGDGGESLRATLQKVGRSIRRKKKGANVVDVVDFADCTHHWLAKHALERFDIYHGEDFDVIEEDGKVLHSQQEKEADGKIRRNGASESRTKAVSALPSKARRRGELLRSGVSQLRTVGRTTEQSANGISEGSDVMHWRWRQAA